MSAARAVPEDTTGVVCAVQWTFVGGCCAVTLAEAMPLTADSLGDSEPQGGEGGVQCTSPPAPSRVAPPELPPLCSSMACCPRNVPVSRVASTAASISRCMRGGSRSVWDGWAAACSRVSTTLTSYWCTVCPGGSSCPNSASWSRPMSRATCIWGGRPLAVVPAASPACCHGREEVPGWHGHHADGNAPRSGVLVLRGATAGWTRRTGWSLLGTGGCSTSSFEASPRLRAKCREADGQHASDTRHAKLQGPGYGAATL